MKRKNTEIPEAVWSRLAMVDVTLGALAEVEGLDGRGVRLLAKIAQLMSPQDEVPPLPVLHVNQTYSFQCQLQHFIN